MRHTLGDPDDIRQILAEQDVQEGLNELSALMANHREAGRTRSPPVSVSASERRQEGVRATQF